MKKIFIITALFIVSIGSVYAGQLATRLGDTEVDLKIQGIQQDVPEGTPIIDGHDRKGNVGTMLSNIFDETDQKIKSYFIQAFKNIFGASNNNNIPKWNGRIFEPGSIWDKDGKIGVGLENSGTFKMFIGGDDPTTGVQQGLRISAASPTGSTSDDYIILAESYLITGNPPNKFWVRGDGTAYHANDVSFDGKVKTDEYCDRDGNNCFTAGGIGGGTDNCYICGNNGSTVQCEKFGGDWVATSSSVKISCTVGGIYTKTGYCKTGNSKGGLFAPSKASCTAKATCNSGDIALRGRGWYKGAGSNYVTALDYNDTIAWHNRVDTGLSGKTWGSPSNINSKSYYASYSNGLGDKHEYIIVGAQVECLEF